MSLDPSLKVLGGNLSQHRNVLKRGERLARLMDLKGFDPKKKSVLGLPKTGNRSLGK